MISDKNFICLTNRYDIPKVWGIRPLDDDKMVYLGAPDGPGAEDVIKALEVRGFTI